jgi:hypothetical protein
MKYGCILAALYHMALAKAWLMVQSAAEGLLSSGKCKDRCSMSLQEVGEAPGVTSLREKAKGTITSKSWGCSVEKTSNFWARRRLSLGPPI